MGHNRCIQIAINNIFRIPDNKPELECILRTTVNPYITTTTVSRKKIFIEGHAQIKMEYVASVPDGSQPIHFLCNEISFSGLIAHSCARPGMRAQICSCIKKQEFHAIDVRNIRELLIINASLLKLQKPYPSLLKSSCEPSGLDKSHYDYPTFLSEDLSENCHTEYQDILQYSDYYPATMQPFESDNHPHYREHKKDPFADHINLEGSN